MELDKRIKEGKRPLNLFDTKEAEKYTGGECYFSNVLEDFINLQNTQKSTLKHIYSRQFRDIKDDFWYFCLPCEWVEEEKKEPKYRPYTIKDFEEAFLKGEFEDFIIMREKENHDNVYTLRYNGNFIYSHAEYICLGGKNIDFRSLFENYEVANYDGDFVPFGVLEE